MDLKQYETRIKDPKRTMIVELWAPWCGPCRMMEPALKQAGQKYAGRVELLRVNADQSQEIVRKLRVFGIPTMIGYSHGEEVFRKTGAQTSASIEKLFERVLMGKQAAPEISSPGKLDRILRLAVGAGLLAVGWFAGREWYLFIPGAVVLFSAVYDRCPIYRAVMPRIREWMHKQRSAG